VVNNPLSRETILDNGTGYDSCTYNIHSEMMDFFVCWVNCETATREGYGEVNTSETLHD